MKRSSILAASMMPFFAAALIPSSAWAVAYTTGDVFAAVGNGQIKEFTPTGVLVQILNDTHGFFNSQNAGMAFDAAGNLYSTNFGANTLVKYNNSGTLITATFGSGYNSDPESVVVDNTNGVVYVGQADGSHNVLKFSLTGTPIGSFAPTVGARGTDWIDLASDLKTLHYTSEGNAVMAFDVSTNTQLPNFASGLPGIAAYAHRILSDGGELVADTSAVVRLNSSGVITHTYALPGTRTLFALNLDPNGTDFWTGDTDSGEVFEVNIATGAIDEMWNAGLIPGSELGGLAVFGEICAACQPVPAPLIGRGLPVLLAVGGLLFGAKVLERSTTRRSLGTAIPVA
jgi:DNA-binding beta-propeller fold protein YncE